MIIGICLMENNLIEFKIIILKKKSFYRGIKILRIDIEISIILQYLIDRAQLVLLIYMYIFLW